MDSNENTNEVANWLDETIDGEYFKNYEYEHFSDIQEIGSGRLGKVFHANWKNLEYLALRSFTFDNVTVKEIVETETFPKTENRF